MHLTPQQWAETKQKLTEEIPLLKLGKSSEVYSKRQSKYKSKFEIYGNYRGNLAETERKPSGKKVDGNIIRTRRGIELELEVEEEVYGNLCKIFPKIDHEQELLKADQWLKDQPTEKKKRNHHRFLRNWFERAQNNLKEKPNARKTDTSKYPERTPLNL